ncbi:restriction endonuclease subunit S [Methanothermococcus sp. SCGC AD-155-C09]|nr:restriction endonuclease subunit S [Methanothermococcus sp. SCGC AD-155-C09]
MEINKNNFNGIGQDIGGVKMREFKETEIGLIPEEWEVVSLEEVAYFETGKRMKGGAIKEGEVFSIGGEHITDEGSIKFDPPKFIKKDFYLRMKKGKVKIGDILICKDGAKTGKTAFIKHLPYNLCAINEHVYIVRSKKNFLINQFLFFFIFSNLGQKQIRNAFHGLIGGINQGDLKNIKIPLPPLEEQKKIAKILDKIQQAIEIQDRIIRQTENLRKSLMQNLFTRGLYGEEQKETEIGPIPKSWEVVRLGDCLELIRNGTTRKQNKEGKGYPVTRIETISNGFIDIKKVGYVELSKKEVEKYRLKFGDILFSHINSEPHLGKSTIYTEYPLLLIHGMNLLLIRSKKNILKPFFLNYLFNYYRERGVFISIASRAVNQSSINQSKIKNLLIPLPPLSEQKQISHILSVVDKKIEIEKKRKEVLKDLFKTMLHKLMSGEIRLKDVEV